jgi:GNAT superfamily N-acetyltransferase
VIAKEWAIEILKNVVEWKNINLKVTFFDIEACTICSCSLNHIPLNVTIDNLAPRDLPEVAALQPEGWSDITGYFTFYLHSNFCRPIKIVFDNQLVGVGNAIMHHDTAWLSHIIVDVQYRNHGLGALITKNLVDIVHKQKINTILLIATKSGEPVYRKIGFEKETEYQSFVQEKKLMMDDESIPFHPSYEKQIQELDKKISGESRSALLKPHLQHARLIVDNASLKGFYLPTLGEGMIIAETDEAGIALLSLKHREIQRTAIPVNNRAAHRFLLKHGFTEGFKGTKMFLGKPISYYPEKNFSRIGGNLG